VASGLLLITVMCTSVNADFVNPLYNNTFVYVLFNASHVCVLTKCTIWPRCAVIAASWSTYSAIAVANLIGTGWRRMLYGHSATCETLML
jgi:hypothetical protein